VGINLLNPIGDSKVGRKAGEKPKTHDNEEMDF